MVDIVKRTAKAGSKLAAAAKPVAAVKAAPAKASARTVAKPAKPAFEPIAKTPAPQPLAAAFVSPHTDIPAPIQAAAPTGIPASETKDATMDTIQSITEKTKALFSGANTAEFNEQAKGAMEKSAKMAEDFVAFGKGNIEALVESSKIRQDLVRERDRSRQDARRRQVADRVHEAPGRLCAHRVRHDDRRGLALDRADAQDVRRVRTADLEPRCGRDRQDEDLGLSYAMPSSGGR
jgi:hypothetical protein